MQAKSPDLPSLPADGMQRRNVPQESPFLFPSNSSKSKCLHGLESRTSQCQAGPHFIHCSMGDWRWLLLNRLLSTFSHEQRNPGANSPMDWIHDHPEATD